jgi:cytochrome c oxidase assembly protein subunit 15
MADQRLAPEPSPLGKPHAVAWVLACAVFPLIWIGGVVTTYEAGMSVEDWPTTFGHWFYPLQKWFYGVWDMFLEHGHRMWAQFVGLLAVLTAAAIGLYDRRRWMWWVAAAILAGVGVQGTLGGLRVIWDERLLAKVHGCTAAAYFGLCAATVAMTSRHWLEAARPAVSGARRFQWLAIAVAALLYANVVLGVQLRHAPPVEGPGWFQLWLWSKLIAAALAASGTVALALAARRLSVQPVLQRRVRLLLGIVAVQLLLGGATWLVNYGVPAWFRNWIWAVEYTVVADGRWQVNLTTAHVAVGSLAFVTAVSVALWSRRLMKEPAP